MANLRQRTPKSPAKRTSSRATAASPSKYEEVKIVSDGSEDILMDTVSEDEADILDGYASDTQIKPTSSSDDISIDEDSDTNDLDEDGAEESEDDKEIRRIIEKTEAETKNIPLTARQRAKLEGGIQDPLQDSSKEGADTLSSEQALKLSEKSRRRKLQRAQKIEETKRATIDRLLQKQKKTPVPSNESELKDSETAHIEDESVLKPGTVRFIDRPSETLLQFPDDSTYQTVLSDFAPPKHKDQSVKKCQICQKNESKYTHPRSGQLFCSLPCYKLIK